MSMLCLVDILYETAFRKSIDFLLFDPKQGKVFNRYESKWKFPDKFSKIPVSGLIETPRAI